ncbi:MAG TPA: type III pantothenate kinase [Acidiferrobacter sp.]|nr:type III pantothenate kinase [Acidiferrobacter sp.]
MMLLCDLGNSRLKWAQWHGALSGFGWGAYEGEENFATRLASAPRPAAIAAISVASRHNAAFRTFCETRWRLTPTWYSASQQGFGLQSLYQPPESLGADRFAAMLGARSRFGARALCVVDCGTAITIDAVDREGIFQGGAILPGMTVAGVALTRAAGALAPVDYLGTVSAAGRNTATAMRAGIMLGTAGAIDRLLADQEVLLQTTLLVVLTGGDAHRLGPHLRHAHEIAPHLTLEGLAVMAA